MPRKSKKPVEGRKIVKAEDKVWHEWFDNLTPKEHETLLEKLGLSSDDRKEFEEELKKEKRKLTV